MSLEDVEQRLRETAATPFLLDELAGHMAATSGLATAPLFASANGGRLRVSAWKRRRFDPAAAEVGLAPQTPGA